MQVNYSTETQEERDAILKAALPKTEPELDEKGRPKLPPGYRYHTVTVFTKKHSLSRRVKR